MSRREEGRRRHCRGGATWVGRLALLLVIVLGGVAGGEGKPATAGAADAGPVAGGVALMAFVASANRNVYALDARTGRRVWGFATSDGVWAPPVVAGSLMYVASLDHHVYALDARTGNQAWSADLGGPIVAAPAVVDGIVYAGTLNGVVTGLDARGGAER